MLLVWVIVDDAQGVYPQKGNLQAFAGSNGISDDLGQLIPDFRNRLWLL
jgi:hypothetical protein